MFHVKLQVYMDWLEMGIILQQQKGLAARLEGTCNTTCDVIILLHVSY